MKIGLIILATLTSLTIGEYEFAPRGKNKMHGKEHNIFPDSCELSCPEGFAEFTMLIRDQLGCPKELYDPNKVRNYAPEPDQYCDAQVKHLHISLKTSQLKNFKHVFFRIMYLQHQLVCSFCYTKEFATPAVIHKAQKCQITRPQMCRSKRDLLNATCSDCVVYKTFKSEL